MFSAFLKCERDFREWVEADFPNINPLSRDFLEHPREPKDGKRMLWEHRMEDVQRATGGAAGEVTAARTALGLWFADLPTSELPAGAEIEFALSCDKKHDAERHRVAIVS